MYSQPIPPVEPDTTSGLPSQFSCRDRISVSLQVAHRISSAALILVLVAIASHFKKLGWPALLAVVILLSCVSLIVALTAYKFISLSHNKSQAMESIGLICFSFFLILISITVHLVMGVPLLPMPCFSI
jgi:hypothetical protein